MQSPSSIDIFALQKKFEANEFPGLIETVLEKYPNCEITVKTTNQKVQQRVIIFQDGKLGYCSHRPVTLDNFVSLIHYKINSDWIDRIFESSKANLSEEMTPRQFCERLLQMRVISKSELLKILLSAFLLSLEPFWSGSGILTAKPLPNQTNLIDIDWRIFRAALEKRQKIWTNFGELSQGIHSTPIITESGVKALQSNWDEGSEELKLTTFIKQSVDGRSKIDDIARKKNVDPLSLAKQIVTGIERGWLGINEGEHSEQNERRGNILVVDDNPTTRKLLVTILHEFYNTVPTPGSLSAVGLIPNQKIDLVIVSHSVPIATGLQLCRIIRQNPDYQRMPIIFISSKENFFDRMKSKMAGVTDYITQPFDRTKILYTLDYHLN